MKIKFGTSGNPPNFFSSKYGKNRLNAPEWINSIGLNAYERMMTYGARMKKEDAIELGKRAKKFNVALSVHGPYYVVLNSQKERVVQNSIKEMIKTAQLTKLMGAKKIVFHPGFGKDVGKIIRGLHVIEKDKPKGIYYCPETMGKLSQLGSVNEVLTICENTESKPCIDFGHVHARTLGSLKKKEDFRKVLIEIEKRLGKKELKDLHCHFYPVEYTDKGEKVHRAVYEKKFHPQFPKFGELLKEFKMQPTLISESKNSQDLGALHMRDVMLRLNYY